MLETLFSLRINHRINLKSQSIHSLGLTTDYRLTDVRSQQLKMATNVQVVETLFGSSRGSNPARSFRQLCYKLLEREKKGHMVWVLVSHGSVHPDVLEASRELYWGCLEHPSPGSVEISFMDDKYTGQISTRRVHVTEEYWDLVMAGHGVSWEAFCASSTRVFTMSVGIWLGLIEIRSECEEPGCIGEVSLQDA